MLLNHSLVSSQGHCCRVVIAVGLSSTHNVTVPTGATTDTEDDRDDGEMDAIAKQRDGTEDAVHRGRLSDVRLARGHTSTPNEGFVQVLYSNQWQFVCSRYWSFKLSSMTCHSLGYTTALLPSDGQIAYRAEAVAEEIPGILRLVCPRNTRNLTACGVLPITIDKRFMCEDNGIAMVTCEKKDEVSMILSVSLHGSDRGTNEGRVGFTSHDSPSQVKLFTNEAWSMKTSHLVCQHLGFIRGAYATLSGNVYNTTESNASLEYGGIRCDQDARNISECWYESRPRDGVSSDMIIAVVCCSSFVCGPEGEPLGISSGIIPDSAITKSSCDASLDCDSTAGRLHSDTTWKPAVYDYASPWLQISLESLHMITGVVTQSHHSYYSSMTSYTVSFRLDTDTWLPYRDPYTNSNSTVFQGNFRPTTPVEHSVHPPLMARFIRLHPRTYVGSPSLRFELIGYGPLADYIVEIYEPNLRCVPPFGKKLGVANSSIIPDSSFSSNPVDRDYYSAYNARLFGNDAWMPALRSSSWWQVDLGTVYQVTGVMTQGRPPLPEHGEPHQWTISYTLSLSIDSGTWVGVSEEHCGFLKEFPANFDEGTPVTNLLPSPLSAQYVRIYPKVYRGYPALRCEILGF